MSEIIIPESLPPSVQTSLIEGFAALTEAVTGLEEASRKLSLIDDKHWREAKASLPKQWQGIAENARQLGLGNLYRPLVLTSSRFAQKARGLQYSDQVKLFEKGAEIAITDSKGKLVDSRVKFPNELEIEEGDILIEPKTSTGTFAKIRTPEQQAAEIRRRAKSKARAKEQEESRTIETSSYTANTRGVTMKKKVISWAEVQSLYEHYKLIKG